MILGVFKVTKSPSELLALTNCVFGSPSDFKNDPQLKHISVKDDKAEYILSIRLVLSYL